MQNVPQTPKLRIRISASDDESDGEQQGAENKATVKQGEDDLKQLEQTAQETAEAVMRVTTEAGSTNLTITAGSDSVVASHDAAAGDNISFIQQQQQQVYYIPPAVYPYMTYQYQSPVTQAQNNTGEIPANLMPNQQNAALFHLPQVSVQVQGYPIQNSQPNQMPPQNQTLVYQVPNPQFVQPGMETAATPQQDVSQCMFEPCTSTTALPAETGDGCPVTSTPKKSLTLGDFIRSSSPKMVYPTVFVSQAGLLTVLLKHEVAVEMTLDRSLRVINNKHKSVAASNTTGTASCIYHNLAKVYQDLTTCEAECFLPERQVAITTDHLKFAFGIHNCYRLVNKSYEFALAYPKFKDLKEDMSISLLFSSRKYGPHFMEAAQEVANAATYKKHRNGALSVYINNMKIYQYPRGDVVVLCGSRYVRVSPMHGSMMVLSHFVEMLLENSHTLKVRRGDYRFKVTEDLLVVSDGFMECGIDRARQVFCQLEMLLVRTIIDNQQSCDKSCTGSREVYNFERNRDPPLMNQRWQRPCPPPQWDRLPERPPRRQMWWRRRGKSHYTMDLDKAIRLANDAKKKEEEEMQIAGNPPGRPITKANKETQESKPEAADETTKTKEEAKDGLEPKKSVQLKKADVKEPKAKPTRSKSVKNSAEPHRHKEPECKQKPMDKLEAVEKKASDNSCQKSTETAQMWSSLAVSPEAKTLGEENIQMKAERRAGKQELVGDHKDSNKSTGDSISSNMPQKDKRNGRPNNKGRERTEYRNQVHDSVKKDESERQKESNRPRRRSKPRPKCDQSTASPAEKETHASKSEEPSREKKRRKSKSQRRNVEKESLPPQPRVIEGQNTKAPNPERNFSRERTQRRNRDDKHPEGKAGNVSRDKVKMQEVPQLRSATEDRRSPGDKMRRAKKSPREKQFAGESKAQPQEQRKSPREHKRASPKDRRYGGQERTRERRNKKKKSTRHYTDDVKGANNNQKEENTMVKEKELEENLNKLVSKLVADVVNSVASDWQAQATQNDKVESNVQQQSIAVTGDVQDNAVTEKQTQREAPDDKSAFASAAKEQRTGSNSQQETQIPVIVITEASDDESNQQELTPENDVAGELKTPSEPEGLTKASPDEVRCKGDSLHAASSRYADEEDDHPALGVTTSADHLETVVHLQKKTSLHYDICTSKKNELKKRGKELRSTKSEDKTSSTKGGVIQGIEVQNNSEGNMTLSTASRVKATEQAMNKPVPEMETIGLATNEKGSGESAEPAALKAEASDCSTVI